LQSNGRFSCPECEMPFSTINDLVTHLVDKTMETGYRLSMYTMLSLPAAMKLEEDRACVLCKHPFTRSAGNKRQLIQRHIDRHFSNRFPCSGRCGLLSCSFIASNSADLSSHCASSGPVPCPSCGTRYSSRSTPAGPYRDCPCPRISNSCCYSCHRKFQKRYYHQPATRLRRLLRQE
jgi:hypothetical protein